MVLDAQALEHLEIFESQGRRKEGTLFEFLDHTKTTFGKRQLKQWVMSPLRDPTQINERLDTVEDLMEYEYEAQLVRAELGKMPDLEKLLSRIFSYSVKNQVKAIYFENVSLVKLREFKTLLSAFKNLKNVIAPIAKKKGEFRSKRLRDLMTLNSAEEPGLFPDLREAIEEFEFMIVWKKVQGSEDDIPEPKPGIDEEFDKANQDVDRIKFDLDEELDKIKQLFPSDKLRINFAHSKYRYEIEIPEELVRGSKKPPFLEFSSSRSGFTRFQTAAVKKIVEQLECAEDKLKNALSPFCCAIF